MENPAAIDWPPANKATDPMKIRFGLDAGELKRQKQTPVIWDSEKLVNGHTLVVGMSGAGKTYTLRKMISHMQQTAGEEQPRIHIFDVHGDVDVPGSSTVFFSEQTHYGLNPLRVNPDPHFGGVRKKVQAFISTMNRVMRQLGSKQEACLRNILYDIYTHYGFKQDDPSTWEVEEDTAVFLTDGVDNRMYIDVPRGEKDEAKALGARWSGAPLHCWWIEADQYQGPITRWPPKLIARTHPSIKDALRVAKNILQMSFLGTGADAVTNLGIANKAAAGYRRKMLEALRKGKTDFEDVKLGEDLEKAKQKAIDSFTEYANSIVTGLELVNLMKYDSTDVLKSVVDRLSNLDAIGIFKSQRPPFDPYNPIWRYNIHALSMEERKLFVLFKLEELFMEAVQRGPQDHIRDVIILDEAHIYADDDPDNIINTLAKESRKFGVALICASQSPTHFPDDFVAAVGTKVVLGIDEMFWAGASRKMRLQEDALSWITARKNLLVQLKMAGETKNDWKWTVIG